MEITRKPLDTKFEEDILLSLIISTEYCLQARPIINLKLFTSKISKLVATWALDYYEAYNIAPYEYIGDIFESHKEELEDTEIFFVQELLQKLDNKYTEIENYNVAYYLDKTEKFFTKQALKQLVEKMNGDIANNKLDKAEHRLTEYKKIDKQNIKGVDLFRDIDKVTQLGLDEDSILFTPPGAFGEMTGDYRRGDFIMLLAKSKFGKSWLLQQHGVWANLMRGLNVLHLSLEMPWKPVKDRYFQQFTGKTSWKYTKPFSVPFFDSDNSIKYCEVLPGELTKEAIEKKAKDLHMQARGSKLIIEARPANSFSIDDLKMLLDYYEEYQNTMFDVLVIDYADLMLASNTRLDNRHQLDIIYKSLRGMAQERNILILTASQGNRDSFKKDSGVTNIAEDIRKITHITHGIVFNQTAEEKQLGLYRASPMGERYKHFEENEEVVVLYSQHIGKMYLDSRWKKDVILE